jgi:hypothetical protein
MSAPEGSGPARLGWRQFNERSWSDVADFERKIWADRPEGRYLLDIINSVLNSGAMDALAVTTSMHDLVVVGRPVPEPPMDVLLVRAPSSIKPPRPGYVLVQYMANSGRNTVSERPATEAVRLFWRFVDEKFGIKASNFKGNPRAKKPR